jgi:hypothetical protein
MEPWRVYRPLVVDSHHFDDDQLDSYLHENEKVDPDPHSSVKLDPDAHPRDADPQP